EVVDAAALTRAIAERQLRVGLDVFDKEPAGASGGFEDPIVKLPQGIGTHHIGASTEQAQSAGGDETVALIRKVVQQGDVRAAVNLAKRSPAAFQLTVRHHDRMGVLAEVLGAIRRHSLNVEEMENIVFEGAQAASAKIRVSAPPAIQLMNELRGV